MDEIRNISREERSKQNKKPTGALLSPYFHLVNAGRLSLITILEIMRLQGTGGVYDGMKATRALIQVGRAVEIEYKAQMCRKSKIQIPVSPRRNDVKYFSNLGYKFLQERRLAAAKHVMDGEAWTAEWTQTVRSRLGGILVECLMDVAQVTRTVRDEATGEYMYVYLSPGGCYCVPTRCLTTALRTNPLSTIHTSTNADKSSALLDSTLWLRNGCLAIACRRRSILATFRCSSSQNNGSPLTMVGISTTRVSPQLALLDACLNVLQAASCGSKIRLNNLATSSMHQLSVTSNSSMQDLMFSAVRPGRSTARCLTLCSRCGIPANGWASFLLQSTTDPSQRLQKTMKLISKHGASTLHV